MMKQAQEMQERLQQQMTSCGSRPPPAAAWSPSPSTATSICREITIDPEVVSKDDVAMLQDLIVAAVNDAHRKVDEAMKQRMGGLLGGLGIPGL